MRSGKVRRQQSPWCGRSKISSNRDSCLDTTSKQVIIRRWHRQFFGPAGDRHRIRRTCGTVVRGREWPPAICTEPPQPSRLPEWPRSACRHRAPSGRGRCRLCSPTGLLPQEHRLRKKDQAAYRSFKHHAHRTDPVKPRWRRRTARRFDRSPNPYLSKYLRSTS